MSNAKLESSKDTMQCCAVCTFAGKNHSPLAGKSAHARYKCSFGSIPLVLKSWTLGYYSSWSLVSQAATAASPLTAGA